MFVRTMSNFLCLSDFLFRWFDLSSILYFLKISEKAALYLGAVLSLTTLLFASSLSDSQLSHCRRALTSYLLACSKMEKHSIVFNM